MDTDLDTLLEGMIKINKRRSFGYGTDVFRLFSCAVDFPENYNTNIVLNDFFLVNKKAEINVLRKIYWEMLSLINDDFKET